MRRAARGATRRGRLRCAGRRWPSTRATSSCLGRPSRCSSDSARRRASATRCIRHRMRCPMQCMHTTHHASPPAAAAPPSPLAIATQVWPAPCRLFNIFHPADPVTFLIEPALMRTPLAPAPEIDGDEQFAPCAPSPGGGGGGNGAGAGGGGGGDAAAEAEGEPGTAGDASPRTSAATEVAAAVAAAKAGAASRFALHEVHRGHGLHYACTAPAPRLHRACTAPAPRLYHFCTAPAPLLHRACAAPAPPCGTLCRCTARYGCSC